MKLLYEFISKRNELDFTYLLKDNSKDINYIKGYKVEPLEVKPATDLFNSGVYCFKHLDTGKLGIGSAMSLYPRLLDHLSSFRGHRTTHYMHE